MSKLQTLAKVFGTILKDPYALKRVLPDDSGSELLSHDDIYDDGYFQFVEQTTTDSADAIADSIVESFHPASVIDIGCGTGVLLERLRSQGVEVKGLEYAEAALDLCRLRQLDVKKFDVTTDDLPQGFSNANVVVSMEVGQQLHETYAERYIDLLSQIAPIAIFSSATPGQGDRKPLNEQPHEYWIDKFSRHGFHLDESLSLKWRAEWQAKGAAPWFCRNVMIFVHTLEAAGDNAG